MYIMHSRSWKNVEKKYSAFCNHFLSKLYIYKNMNLNKNSRNNSRDYTRKIQDQSKYI